MEERTIYNDTLVPADHQAAVVAQPAEGTFYLPSPPVSSQFSPILRGLLAAVALVRTDQLDTASGQSTSQRVAVIGLVGDDPSRIFPRTTSAFARHRDLLDCRFQQFHFRRAGRVQVVAQRNSLAVDHHHPLRALAAFGRPDAAPPFLAGAKLPSAKHSDQSNWPFSSNWPRKVRQTRNQTSCSSQSCNRRQHVLGEGYCLGKSCQRAPVRSIHRMPSNTGRFPTGLRPPLRDLLNLGSSGSIFAHCSSVNIFRLAIATPFAIERKT